MAECNAGCEGRSEGRVRRGQTRGRMAATPSFLKHVRSSTATGEFASTAVSVCVAPCRVLMRIASPAEGAVREPAEHRERDDGAGVGGAGGGARHRARHAPAGRGRRRGRGAPRPLRRARRHAALG